MAGLLTQRSKNAALIPRPTIPSTSRIMRHHEYYIPSADAAFLTGTVLFRVHRYFFIRESPVFQEIFRSRLTDLDSPRRVPDSEPIVLDGVGVEDFECFLWVIYNPKYSLYVTTSHNWFRALSFATEWQFPIVKQLAVSHLENQRCNPVDKIAAYHDCKIDETLLLPSYIELCGREDFLVEDEANLLDMATVLKLVRVREELWKMIARGKEVDTEDAEVVIREVFKISGFARSEGRPKSALSRITEADEPCLDSLSVITSTTTTAAPSRLSYRPNEVHGETSVEPDASAPSQPASPSLVEDEERGDPEPPSNQGAFLDSGSAESSNPTFEQKDVPVPGPSEEESRTIIQQPTASSSHLTEQDERFHDGDTAVPYDWTPFESEDEFAEALADADWAPQSEDDNEQTTVVNVLASAPSTEPNHSTISVQTPTSSKHLPLPPEAQADDLPSTNPSGQRTPVPDVEEPSPIEAAPAAMPPSPLLDEKQASPPKLSLPEDEQPIISDVSSDMPAITVSSAEATTSTLPPPSQHVEIDLGVPDHARSPLVQRFPSSALHNSDHVDEQDLTDPSFELTEDEEEQPATPEQEAQQNAQDSKESDEPSKAPEAPVEVGAVDGGKLDDKAACDNGSHDGQSKDEALAKVPEPVDGALPSEEVTFVGPEAKDVPLGEVQTPSGQESVPQDTSPVPEQSEVRKAADAGPIAQQVADAGPEARKDTDVEPEAQKAAAEEPEARRDVDVPTTPKAEPISATGEVQPAPASLKESKIENAAPLVTHEDAPSSTPPNEASLGQASTELSRTDPLAPAPSPPAPSDALLVVEGLSDQPDVPDATAPVLSEPHAASTDDAKPEAPVPSTDSISPTSIDKDNAHVPSAESTEQPLVAPTEPFPSTDSATPIPSEFIEPTSGTTSLDTTEPSAQESDASQQPATVVEPTADSKPSAPSEPVAESSPAPAVIQEREAPPLRLSKGQLKRWKAKQAEKKQLAADSAEPALKQEPSVVAEPVATAPAIVPSISGASTIESAAPSEPNATSTEPNPASSVIDAPEELPAGLSKAALKKWRQAQRKQLAAEPASSSVPTVTAEPAPVAEPFVSAEPVTEEPTSEQPAPSDPPTTTEPVVSTSESTDSTALSNPSANAELKPSAELPASTQPPGSTESPTTVDVPAAIEPAAILEPATTIEPASTETTPLVDAVAAETPLVDTSSNPDQPSQGASDPEPPTTTATSDVAMPAATEAPAGPPAGLSKTALKRWKKKQGELKLETGSQATSDSQPPSAGVSTPLPIPSTPAQQKDTELAVVASPAPKASKSGAAADKEVAANASKPATPPSTPKVESATLEADSPAGSKLSKGQKKKLKEMQKKAEEKRKQSEAAPETTETLAAEPTATSTKEDEPAPQLPTKDAGDADEGPSLPEKEGASSASNHAPEAKGGQEERAAEGGAPEKQIEEVKLEVSVPTVDKLVESESKPEPESKPVAQQDEAPFKRATSPPQLRVAIPSPGGTLPPVDVVPPPKPSNHSLQPSGDETTQAKDGKNPVSRHVPDAAGSKEPVGKSAPPAKQQSPNVRKEEQATPPPNPPAGMKVEDGAKNYSPSASPRNPPASAWGPAPPRNGPPPAGNDAPPRNNQSSPLAQGPPRTSQPTPGGSPRNNQPSNLNPGSPRVSQPSGGGEGGPPRNAGAQPSPWGQGPPRIGQPAPTGAVPLARQPSAGARPQPPPTGVWQKPQSQGATDLRRSISRDKALSRPPEKSSTPASSVKGWGMSALSWVQEQLKDDQPTRSHSRAATDSGMSDGGDTVYYDSPETPSRQSSNLPGLAYLD